MLDPRLGDLTKRWLEGEISVEQWQKLKEQVYEEQGNGTFEEGRAYRQQVLSWIEEGHSTSYMMPDGFFVWHPDTKLPDSWQWPNKPWWRGYFGGEPSGN